MIKSSSLLEENMSNLTSASGEQSASASSINLTGSNISMYSFPSLNQTQTQPQPVVKKKRNQPGNPDPGAEVIALSPKTLMATNRFVCEICNKGFQRDQNLQLHRRGHSLPWKLKQRSSKDIIRKKVYVCPETTCVHHEPSRALGDLTGIKKHFCRKHGEKKWKCEKCSKKYAVQSDWKAHSKTCGTKEYRCDCGTLFSRRDSFITHRAFCDALAEESAKSIPGNSSSSIPLQATAPSSSLMSHHHLNVVQSHFSNSNNGFPYPIKKEQQNFSIPPWLACSPVIGPGPGPGPPPIDLTTTSSSLVFQDFHGDQNPNPSKMTNLPPYHPPPASPHISATALLQKAAQMGATTSSNSCHTHCASPAGVFIRPHHHDTTHMSDISTTTRFGLNLSSRDEFINSLASYGNKAAAAVTGGGASQRGGTSNSPSNSAALLLHDMMMNSPHPLSSGFNEGSAAFEDIAFDHHEIKGGDETFHATLGEISRNGGNDGMTRDFLGLRPLSQNEILSIMNRNAACNENLDDQEQQAQNSWQ